jgi:hypothetical protein
MAKKGRAARPNVRKSETPREALAVLHTVDEHIRENIKAYRAHKLPKPIAGDDVEFYAAARGQRLLRMLILRRLRRFAEAVKVYGSARNKKSIGRLLGLERGPGRPVGSKLGKSLDLAREISVQRETKSETRKTRKGEPARTRWKEVARNHDMSDQAARKRAKRASQVRAEEDAKEFAARLKQSLEKKPPRAGKAKARSAAMAKTIRAQNRRKR